MGEIIKAFQDLISILLGNPEGGIYLLDSTTKLISMLWSTLMIFLDILTHILKGISIFTDNFWFFIMIIELFIVGASIFTQKTDSTSKAYTYIYNFCFYHVMIFNLFFIFMRGLYKTTTSIMTAIGNWIPST